MPKISFGEVYVLKKYQEVEAKFPLYNMEYVIENIKKLNLDEVVRTQIQIDSYYTPAHRNFLESDIISEWLRIRETDQGCSLNFKQWLAIGAVIQNQCNEYETQITDSFALKSIVSALDFKQIIVVNKTRNSWIYDKVEISIDYVEELGAFIELEAVNKVEESEIENMNNYFNYILEMLGAKVGERDRRGYPYLLLEKAK